jgi:hypothetical protein
MSALSCGTGVYLGYIGRYEITVPAVLSSTDSRLAAVRCGFGVSERRYLVPQNYWFAGYSKSFGVSGSGNQ